MDNDAVVAVADVVKDLTGKGELFSCFDVTRKLRDEQSLTVFHSEVRKEVHKLYADMEMPVDYERDDFALKNGRTTCVFHPRGKATSEYDPEQFGGGDDPFGAKTTKTSQPTMVPKANLLIAPKNQTDRRGRLCISNKMTRKMGVDLTAGTTAWVSTSFANKRILISKSPSNVSDPGAAVRAYSVDKDDNIRLSRRLLKKADILGKQLNVYVSGVTIIVE